MAIRKVALMGNPILRKKAAPIPVEAIQTEAVQQLVVDMVETMHEYDGQGLAAPQVHESVQMVVMLWNFDPEAEPELKVLINPKIKPLTEKASSYWEGCLSVPGLRGLVSRPNRISVEAYDQNAKPLKFEAEGFAATVVQHECDHLEGTLYVDRIQDLTSGFAFNREHSRYLVSPEDPTNEDE